MDFALWVARDINTGLSLFKGLPTFNPSRGTWGPTSHRIGWLPCEMFPRLEKGGYMKVSIVECGTVFKRKDMPQ